MATSRAVIRSSRFASGFLNKIKKSPANSTRLLKLCNANGSSSSTLKARALSQLVPCLALQVSRQMAGPTNTTLLEKCFIAKPSALTLAVNEAEVTSVEETDEDDEATLYILSEMFSMLCIWPGDG